MKIISHTNEGREYLLVEVAIGRDFTILNEYSFLSYERVFVDTEKIPGGNRSGHRTVFAELPPGSYRIIGLASEVGEDVAGAIVQPNCDGDISKCPSCGCMGECASKGEYINYAVSLDGEPTYSAMESLASLLRSHSLTPSTTLIIQKQ